jgi:hypothetical protein
MSSEHHHKSPGRLLAVSHLSGSRSGTGHASICPALFGAIALFFNALDIAPGIYTYRSEAGKIISGAGLDFLSDADFTIARPSKMTIAAITFRVEREFPNDRWIETLTLRSLHAPPSPALLALLEGDEEERSSTPGCFGNGITYTHYRLRDFWQESFQQLETSIQDLNEPVELLSRKREIQYLKTLATDLFLSDVA